MKTTTIRLTVLAAALALSLTACGGSDDSTADDPAGTNSEGAQFQGGPGGGDPEQFAEIQECLEAAGLADSLPSGGPQGGERPSDFPTDGSMPSDFPTDGAPPEGMPSGGPGGGPGGGFMDDPEIQAALEACGITMPSGPPEGQTG